MLKEEISKLKNEYENQQGELEKAIKSNELLNSKIESHDISASDICDQKNKEIEALRNQMQQEIEKQMEVTLC
jgi:hypothetical protein